MIREKQITKEHNKFHFSNMLYTIHDQQQGKVLLYSGRSGILRQMPIDNWQLFVDEETTAGSIHYKNELAMLIQDEILVPVEEDEYQCVQTRNKCLIDQRSEVYVVVMPYAGCNMACNYCGQSHTNVALTGQSSNKFIDWLYGYLKKLNRGTLYVAWMGGEALVRYDILKSLTERMMNMCRELSMGYRSKIVTNGLLLSDKVTSELTGSLGVRYIEITLDGPPASHDTRRIRKDGTGSYDKIFSNLLASLDVAKANGARIRVRCNVDKRNFLQCRQLIETFTEHNLLPQVNLYFAPVYSWGDSEGQTYSFEASEWAEISLSLAIELQKAGISGRLLPKSSVTPCMHGDTYSRVVSPSGKLYRCTEVPLVTSYESDDVDVNPSPQGYWVVDNQEGSTTRGLPSWQEEIEDECWPCKTCKLYGVCAGNCPRQWREGRQACPAFYYNVEKRMKLMAELNQVDIGYVPNNPSQDKEEGGARDD